MNPQWYLHESHETVCIGQYFLGCQNLILNARHWSRLCLTPAWDWSFSRTSALNKPTTKNTNIFSAPSIQQLKQEKLSAWKASNRARVTIVVCNPLHSNSLKGLLNSWPWETKNKWWMKIKYFWGQHQHTLPALGTDLPRLQVSGSPENWKYRNVEFGQCFDSKPS